MRDQIIPTRRWRFDVRRSQDGQLEILEADLDIPPGATFDDIKQIATDEAERRTRVAVGVDWLETSVDTGEADWT